MSIRRILNIAITVVCILILLALTVFLAIRWPQIPDQIPSNYAMDGTVTNYEGKVSLIFQVVFAWAICGLLTWMSVRPVEKGGALRFTRMRALRIGKKGGVDFVERARQINPSAANNVGIDMLMCMRLALTLLFSFLILSSVLGDTMTAWMLPLALALVFVPVIVNLVRLFRIAKGYG